jgi:hypothetical protein
VLDAARIRTARALALLSLSLVSEPGSATPARSEPIEKTTDGAPTVVLDRLDFPSDFSGHARYRQHLLTVLKREARRATWGAGRDNRVEYRFQVSELAFSLSGDVLHIRCSANGVLPGGQRAKSELTFGGSLAERDELIKKVLDIVARGVVTRLAELERMRRGLR